MSESYCAAVRARFPDNFAGRVLELDSPSVPNVEPFNTIIARGVEPTSEWMEAVRAIERLLRHAGLFVFTSNGELTEADLCWSLDGFRAFINYQFSRHNGSNEFCGWMIKR